MTLTAVKSFSHEYLKEALPFPLLLPELIPLIAEYGLVEEISRLFNEETLPLFQYLWGKNVQPIALLRYYFEHPANQMVGRILTRDPFSSTWRTGILYRTTRVFRQSATDIFYGMAITGEASGDRFLSTIEITDLLMPEPLTHPSTPKKTFYLLSAMTLHWKRGSLALKVHDSLQNVVQDIMLWLRKGIIGTYFHSFLREDHSSTKFSPCSYSNDAGWDDSTGAAFAALRSEMTLEFDSFQPTRREHLP